MQGFFGKHFMDPGYTERYSFDAMIVPKRKLKRKGFIRTVAFSKTDTRQYQLSQSCL